jgi:hypothetical protein
MQSYSERENWTTEMRNKQLLAQRDAYISGFNIFIFALLRLAYTNLRDTNRLTASENAITKQAKNLQTAYTALSDEKDKQDSDLNALKELVNEKDKSFDLDDFLKAKHDLTTQLTANQKLTTEHEKEIKTLKTSLEVLKKQAESQGNQAAESLQMDAYNKLVEENKSLKDQLKEADIKSVGQNGNKKND